MAASTIDSNVRDMNHLAGKGTAPYFHINASVLDEPLYEPLIVR